VFGGANAKAEVWREFVPASRHPENHALSDSVTGANAGSWHAGNRFSKPLFVKPFSSLCQSFFQAFFKPFVNPCYWPNILAGVAKAEVWRGFFPAPRHPEKHA